MSRKEYYDLDVWNESKDLSLEVYKITKQFPKEEQFALVSQMLRCAVSVPSNIAEGCGRSTPNDRLRFLFIANDLKYIDPVTLKRSLEKVTSCKKLINGFAKYYKQQSNNQQPATNNKQPYDYSRR